MTRIIAIDPGPEESAWVAWNGNRICGFGKRANEIILAQLHCDDESAVCVIEQIASMGMAVGAEVFETCVWTGRFWEAFLPGKVERIKRHEVKSHHCHSSRAKDSNIRQAIIDRFGGKDRAIGRKASPGPLYGISGDCWQALAVGIVYWDRNRGTLETQ